MACPFSASLRAPRGLPAETRPLDVRRQPEAHQARLPEAHLDDARMSAAILRLSRLESARYDNRAVLGGDHHCRRERRLQLLGERWRNRDLLDRGRRAVVAAAAFLRIPVVGAGGAGNS